MSTFTEIFTTSMLAGIWVSALVATAHLGDIAQSLKKLAARDNKR